MWSQLDEGTQPDKDIEGNLDISPSKGLLMILKKDINSCFKRLGWCMGQGFSKQVVAHQYLCRLPPRSMMAPLKLIDWPPSLHNVILTKHLPIQMPNCLPKLVALIGMTIVQCLSQIMSMEPLKLEFCFRRHLRCKLDGDWRPCTLGQAWMFQILGRQEAYHVVSGVSRSPCKLGKAQG